MNRETKALNIISFILILFILKVGQSIFLPFIFALFIWILIHILFTKYSTLLTKILKLPLWSKVIAKPLAIITIAGIFYFIIAGIKSNVDDVSNTFSSYKKTLNDLIVKLQDSFGIKNKITFEQFSHDINLSHILNSIFHGFTTFLSNSIMVIVYLFFFLLEEKSFTKKLPCLFSNKKQEKDAKNMISKIYSKIEDYISVKLFTSFITGLLGYLVMNFVGLDFALFWGIIMFLFNFIPTVGSIISSILPISLALLQFNNNLVSFSIVSVSIILIQLIIGNFLDPKMMGKKLNLSPLVLIISLVIWGSIWGIVGMFLCVPIMIIITIILLQIPSTKKFAMFLTADGNTF